MIYTFDDDYQLVEATLSFNTDPDDLVIVMRAITSATFLATGTTKMEVAAYDFDAFGTFRYYMIVPMEETWNHSSCHWREYYVDTDGDGLGNVMVGGN